MSTLYELTEQWKLLLEMSQDPEIDEEAIIDTMKDLQCSINDKADNYAIVIRELTANIEKHDKEIKRLQKSKQTMQNNVLRLKNNLLGLMLEQDKKELKTDLNNFKVKVSKSVHVTDIGELRADLVKATFTANKTAIKKAIEAGDVVSGAEIVENKSLNIR